MSWTRVTCGQADRILGSRKHVVLTGSTDVDAGESYREWGTEDGVPVLRERMSTVANKRLCLHEVPDASGVVL